MASTAPANLNITTNFNDQPSLIPNNIIDAHERSSLTVNIQNQGRGIAFAVKLAITQDSDAIKIDNQNIGDIAPGKHKKIKIPIQAGPNLADGTATFIIQAKEQRGYDSLKKGMRIPTRALRAPALTIVNYRLNDT
ncbi:hypothetical protein TI03_07240, partial [Achromatium sp. WMS1]